VIVATPDLSGTGVDGWAEVDPERARLLLELTGPVLTPNKAAGCSTEAHRHLLGVQTISRDRAVGGFTGGSALWRLIYASPSVGNVGRGTLICGYHADDTRPCETAKRR
jgi:hypothetical protein